MIYSLSEIAERLGQEIVVLDAHLAIVVQTGYDESGLVGTRDAYLRLARALVQFVVDAESGQTELWNVGSLQLPGAVDVRKVFGHSFEVSLDTTCLTASEAETQAVAAYFSQGSPPAST